MSRSGMGALIAELREMTNAGTADYTVAGSAYFSDDAIQQELDNTQVIARLAPLIPIFTPTAGAFQWFDFRIPNAIGQWIEDPVTGGTTSGWNVRDGSGAALGTSLYSVNLPAQKITFTADQAGAMRYLDCLAYDLNKAAANVWRRKASFEQLSIDWQSDNHKIGAEMRFQHCIEMAKHYENQGGLSYSELRRVDEEVNWQHNFPWEIQPDPHRRFNDW